MSVITCRPIALESQWVPWTKRGLPRTFQIRKRTNCHLTFFHTTPKHRWNQHVTFPMPKSPIYRLLTSYLKIINTSFIKIFWNTALCSVITSPSSSSSSSSSSCLVHGARRRVVRWANQIHESPPFITVVREGFNCGWIEAEGQDRVWPRQSSGCVGLIGDASSRTSQGRSPE